MSPLVSGAICLYISGSPPQIETIGAPALIGGSQRFLQRHLIADGVLVLDDPAATDTGEIAGVKRFEHQDQRKILFARTLLAHHVAGQVDHQPERYAHNFSFPRIG